MPEPARSDLESSENCFGYLLIALFVLLLYCGTIGAYIQFNRTVLPMGDPFTYTTGFFWQLDLAQKDLPAPRSAYGEGLHMAFKSNWYWMLNLPIVLLSPILVKEPFSLSIVNFIMWCLATAAFFRLARRLNFSVGFSFFAAWLPWMFPVHYGFLDYTSLPVLGLDAMFLGALHLALATTVVYAMDPSSLKSAVLAGVSTGLAVWGRGNSLPVVLMTLFFPVAVVVFKLWKQRGKRGFVGFAIFMLLWLAMAVFFYIKQGTQIMEYYKAHMAFVERHHWSLKDAMPYIRNVPGFFFWRVENSIPTIAVSWLMHGVVAAGLFATFRRNGASSLRLLAATGSFIYFATFLTNILLFTDPHMNIYNCLLVYAPMRIGMALCLFALAAAFVLARKIDVGRWVVFPVLAFGLVYGIVLTKIQTPRPLPGVPTPVAIESFAKGLDGLLGPDGRLSVLYYRHYNPVILNYYRRKNDLPDVNIFMGKHYNDIWSQFDYSEEKRLMVRDEIKRHFEEASLIVIPEYVDAYGLQNPYSFYQFRDEFPRYLNAPGSPRFVVRMLLQEYDVRLLVLQRESEANGMGEPLKLPYGSSQESHPGDYGSKVVRYK